MASSLENRWLSRSIAILLVACLSTILSLAYPRSQVPKLGVLWINDAKTAEPYVRHLKEGLRQLGWVHGRNIEILERYDGGDPVRRAEMAAELVALEVDVLHVVDPALPAARNATRTIPIVCADFYDPIAEGHTSSLARPDRNVTGISWQTADSALKRLQLTLELVPKARRIGWLFDTTDLGAGIELRGAQEAARVAGVGIEQFGVRNPQELELALAKLKHAHLDALVVSASPLTWPAIRRIAKVATAHRVPVISEPVDFAKAGAVLTYGPDIFELYGRSAYFVDRILKGVVPADLPIEQPTRFQLAVNLKIAKLLGLDVPASLIVQATDVIR